MRTKWNRYFDGDLDNSPEITGWERFPEARNESGVIIAPEEVVFFQAGWEAWRNDQARNSLIVERVKTAELLPIHNAAMAELPEALPAVKDTPLEWGYYR